MKSALSFSFLKVTKPLPLGSVAFEKPEKFPCRRITSDQTSEFMQR